MLGALIQGGLGLYGMYKGNKAMSNVANNMPSQEDLSGRLGKSQGLILTLWVELKECTKWA